MKSMITNVCSLSILLSTLASTGVPAAFAQDFSHSQVEVASNSKFSVIRDTLAQLSKVSDQGEGRIKAISEATLSLKEAGVTSDDVEAFAISDLSAVEANGVREKMADLRANKADLSDLVGSLLSSQASGSHFMSCTTGGIIGGVGVLTFIIAGALLLGESSKISKHKEDIKALQLQAVDIQSEINILKSEGVSESSYLITTRVADLTYLNAQMSQLNADKEQAKKSAMTLGIITGVGAAASVIGMIGTDC